MTIQLHGRKALIVGGSGGMGRSIATALAAEGMACAVLGRSAEALAQTVEACRAAGADAHSVLCDLSRTDGLEAATAEAIDRLGGLNALINCAGAHERGKGHEVELAAWDRVLDTNLRAHYHLCRHALPEINKQPGGAVIKIGSITASSSGAGMHVAASQALDGFSQALFEDVREFGTKVCVIRPGFVNTRMSSSDRLDSQKMIQPEDIARTILFVLSMPATACPTEIVLRPQRTPYRPS